jgi:hypothetical protein
MEHLKINRTPQQSEQNDASACGSTDNDDMSVSSPHRKKAKKPWSQDEDDRLLELTKIYGIVAWTVIAEHLPLRTGKQCRERYHNHLQTDIKKGDWTEEEDRLIVELQAKHGNQWAKITKYLPGRSDNAVKNRWHAAIRSLSRAQAKEQRIKPKESAPKAAKVNGRKHPLVPFLSLGGLVASTSSSISASVSEIIKSVSPRLDALWSMHDHAHEHSSGSCTHRSTTSTNENSGYNFSQMLSPRLLDRLFTPWSPKLNDLGDYSKDTTLLSAREVEFALFKSDNSELADFGDIDTADESSSESDRDFDWDVGREDLEYDDMFPLFDELLIDSLSQNGGLVSECDDQHYLQPISARAKIGNFTVSPRSTPRSPRADELSKKLRGASNEQGYRKVVRT